MLVTKISALSGKEATMELDVTAEQLDRFENRIKNREYVQTIFPHLRGDEREFILTGITPTEWENTFSKQEIEY